MKIESVVTKVYQFPQGRLCTLHPLSGSIDKRRHTNGHWDDSEGELNQKNNAEISWWTCKGLFINDVITGGEGGSAER